MVSPAVGQKSTEAPYSWIRRLPAEIRHNIIRIAAKSLTRQYPTPTTPVELSIRYSRDSNGVPKKQYWAKGYRSVAQHESLEPLLGACKTTRTAVLGTEVFSLEIKRDTNRPNRPLPLYDRFVQNPPPLPLFEGATQDLVLSKVSGELDLWNLFSTISCLFGTKIRRIHLTNVLEKELQSWPREWIPSSQTQGAYLSGRDGRDLGAVEAIFRHGTLASFGIIVQDNVHRPVESMFEHEDALAFEISAIQRHREGVPYPQHQPSKPVQICEVLRQYSDGRLMMNKGLLNAGVEARDNSFCPMGQEVFKGIARFASSSFPDIEYVSACVQYSDADPKTNL